MDADLMITIAFCLEVFLFGLVATVAAAGGVRKANREAAAEGDRDRANARAEAIAPRRLHARMSRTAGTPRHS